MIKIRLSGTRDELTQAMSITRQDYTILGRSKAHKNKTDAAHWNITIHAEIKEPLALTAMMPDGQIEPIPESPTGQNIAQMEDDGNRQVMK